MAQEMSRRNFIKSSTIAAGAAAATVTPLSSAVAKPNPKSKVVVIKDKRSASKSGSRVTVHKQYIPEMVDRAIMLLTGVFDKPKAYEAIFTKGLTTSTKIAIKRNGVSAGSGGSWPDVYNAFKAGLLTMLNGTFPERNITMTTGRQRPGSINSSNPKFKVGSYEYAVGNVWVEADYVINMPVCWGHGTSHGVTMGLKNMMSATSQIGDSISSFTVRKYHGYEQSESSPWESIVNVQFKEKTPLILMDAVACRSDGGPGGRANVAGGQIIASRDLVANDYVGYELLKDNGLSSSRQRSAIKIFGLAAKSPYNLGNNKPEDIEKVTWDLTSIHNAPSSSVAQTRVTTKTIGRRVEFSLPKANGRSVQLEIFDMKGKKIWSQENLPASRVHWSGVDNNRNPVSQGVYLYNLKAGSIQAKGDIRISD